MEEDEFFSAIGKGDREVISHFIQSYPERWKEAANELGETSLHFALDAETAEFLISAGASLEAVDNQCGLTPFLRAVRSRNLEVMAVLIGTGCNIFAKSYVDNGALAIASGIGHLESAKRLVAFGLSVNEHHEARYTSLHLACHKGHVETAEFLISSGARLEALDVWGYTPFLRAVIKGESEVMAVLIKRGCNVFVKNFNGNGALALASQEGYLHIAKQLVEIGLRVNERHQDGFTSLHWACRDGRAETAKYLISAGASRY
ncbi:ankyrin repeat domain-containing protein 29-like isoform X3 [Oscarella lobularis]|uniref:ankyrin repeat domain-containing protein 29-like isoform X3 n=1 Tax=Oscarella lobularis TaxID=121494 RepID=UPI003313B4CA